MTHNLSRIILLLLAAAVAGSGAVAQPVSPESPADEIGGAPDAPGSLPAPTPEPLAGPPAPINIKLVDPRAPETILATTANGDITMQSLFDYYALYLAPASAVPILPAVDPRIVPQMPARYLDKLARSMAIAMAAEKAAAEIQDPQIQAQYEKDFNAWLVNYSMPQVRKTFILDKLTTPSQETVRAIYDSNIAAYKTPFQFKMRHIFLRTYDPYTTQEGDTLEKIAQTISGDAAQAGEILADVPGKPRRGLSPKDPTRRLFKPLAPGEKLLVPMHPERADAVRRAADQVRALLEQGRPFEELAAKFSQNETKGEEIGDFPSGVPGGRGIDPAILEVARTLPEGGISPVIRTRHGYVIFKVTKRTEEGVKPFDQAAQEIVKSMQERQTKKLERELVDFMFSQPELTVEVDMFADPENRKKGDIVLRVGNQPFTWGEVEPAWRKGGGDLLKTREEIIGALRDHAGIFNALGLVWAMKTNVFAQEGMDKRYKVLRTGVIGATHIKNQMEALARQQVNDQTIQKFYDDHKDERYRRNAIATYQIVERQPGPGFDMLDEAAKKAELERLRGGLDQQLAGISSLPQFIKLAKDTNPPEPNATTPGVLPYAASVPLNSDMMGGRTGEWLRKLKPKEWSPAFMETDRVRSIALLSIKDHGYQSLAEARNDIVTEMLKKAREETGPKLEQQWGEAARYQFILKDEEPEKAG